MLYNLFLLGSSFTANQPRNLLCDAWGFSFWADSSLLCPTSVPIAPSALSSLTRYHVLCLDHFQLLPYVSWRAAQFHHDAPIRPWSLLESSFYTNFFLDSNMCGEQHEDMLQHIARHFCVVACLVNFLGKLLEGLILQFGLLSDSFFLASLSSTQWCSRNSCCCEVPWTCSDCGQTDYQTIGDTLQENEAIQLSFIDMSYMKKCFIRLTKQKESTQCSSRNAAIFFRIWGQSHWGHDVPLHPPPHVTYWECC